MLSVSAAAVIICTDLPMPSSNAMWAVVGDAAYLQDLNTREHRCVFTRHDVSEEKHAVRFFVSVWLAVLPKLFWLESNERKPYAFVQA